MKRNWRERLSVFQKRIYDRSVSITSIDLIPTPQLLEAVETLPSALAADNQPQVQELSQTIVNHICWRLRVRTVRVRVQGTRPSSRWGELHGLYTQYQDNDGSRSDSIQVWMRTAKRVKIVAFRTYLRTLLHEVCHHLDYTHFELRESYHTDGFFQRESSLFRAIVRPQEEREEKPAEPVASPLAMVNDISDSILVQKSEEL